MAGKSNPPQGKAAREFTPLAIISILAAVMAAFWLLTRLRAVLTPLAAAWFIAYALDPILDKLESWRIPRQAGILILVILAVSVVGVLSLFGIPAILGEIRLGASALPGYLESMHHTLRPEVEKLLNRTLPGNFNDQLNAMTTQALGSLPNIVSALVDAAGQMFSSAKGAVGTMVNITFIPIFAFFLLLNFNGTGGRIIDLAPNRYRKTVRRIFERSDAALGGFVRGQLAVCAILAIIYSVGLTLTGIDMPLAVGMLSGALFVAPYIGSIIGLALACLLAFLKFHDFTHLFYVCAVFGIGQLIEGFILTPKIVGAKVGLSPLAVIVAVLAGGELFGFMGIVIAVPFAAVMRVCLEEGMDVYQRSEYYRRAK